MNRWKYWVAMSMLIAFGAAASDTIAVTVNGSAITKKQVDRQIKALIPQASFHASVSESKLKEIEREALDDLINKELLYQYAKQQGINVSQKQLDDAETELIQGFKGQKNYEKALFQNGLSVLEFRKELRAELLIRNLYEQKIKMSFSDDEVKEYYDKNRYKFKEPEKIHVMMIYTKNDPQIKNGRQIARKRADEAMVKLKEGEDFSAVAAKYSNDMTRIKGGDLGMIHRGRIENAEAEKAAYALKKGEMSKIIDTDIGCFIFYLKERQEAVQVPFSAIKDKLKGELKSSREKEKMDAILVSLRKQAVIKK